MLTHSDPDGESKYIILGSERLKCWNGGDGAI